MICTGQTVELVFWGGTCILPITSIEGLKIIVRAVLKALPELQNTVIVLIFFLLIFATGGVNLFSGMLK